MRAQFFAPFLLLGLTGFVGAQSSDADEGVVGSSIVDDVPSPETESPIPSASVSGGDDGETASSTPTASESGGGGSSPTGGSGSGSQGPPDVHLKVPELSVGRIELDVDNLRADINLNAEIARLVEINAGVQVSVEKVNITIADVEAELELVVRLGHLVEIVNRTLESLDLNPALIQLIDSATDLVEGVIGVVDGLLGSILQGDTRINFLIDNLGNIVQEVTEGAGDAVSTIVGNWRDNMTFTGQERNVGQGLVEKTFEYTELDALVNIVFNSLNQIVQAQVVKGGGSSPGDDDDDEEEEDEEEEEEDADEEESAEPSTSGS